MSTLVTTKWGILELITTQPSAPISETLEHLTDVMRAVDGTEYRVQLRANPRQSFSYQYPADALKKDPSLFNVFYGKIRSKFAIPIFTQASHMATDAAKEATTISMSDPLLKREIRTGDLVILWRSATDFYVLKDSVVDVEGQTIEFSNPLTKTWPVSSTLVIPLRVAYLADKVNRQTSGISSQWSMDFDIIDTPDLGNPLTPAAYNSLDFYPGALEVDGSTRSKVFDELIDEYDPKLGMVFKRTRWKNTRTTMSGYLWSDGPDEVYDIKQRFQRHAGKYRYFYTPNHEVNIRVKSISGVTVDIHPDEYGQNQQHKTLMFMSLNGTYTIRKVTGAVAVDTETTRLTLDGAVTIPIADLFYVTYLGLCRLDSDTLEIEHGSNRKSRAALRIIEILPN